MLALALGPAVAQAETAAFFFTGAEQSFLVPAGVTSVQVTAVAAAGASPSGGRGATVSATVSVSPGQSLYVEVGGSGPGAGFNGGGSPRGGGASDVRFLPATQGVTSLQSRFLVAAGGGGSGSQTFAGGSAGFDGGGGDLGGRAGTQTAGGAPGVGESPNGAGRGGLGVGGSGVSGGGGGGGGGLYGGGSGGNSATQGNGGGGGGSSSVPPGGSSGLAPANTPASVTLVYTRPPPAPPSPPPSTPPPSTPPPRDTAAPTVSGFAVTPTSFSAANIGPAVSAAVGGRVTYRLSEPAKTTFKVERAVKGRRKGRKCVTKRAPRSGRRCIRYMAVKGSFTHNGTAGLNSFKFTGRVRNRSLRRGTYRLVALATDGAGNRSKPKRTAFRIK